MKPVRLLYTSMVATAVLIGGCANNNYRPSESHGYSNSSSYGVVDSIDVVESDNTGMTGAVIGGVVGGVLGNQVGGGRGNTAATIAGAAGGAVVGHEIEKRNNQNSRYRIGVRLEDGSYRTVTQDSSNDLHVGSRVRVENNQVYRY